MCVENQILNPTFLRKGHKVDHNDYNDVKFKDSLVLIQIEPNTIEITFLTKHPTFP